MKRVDEKELEVAGVYARALVGLADEAGEADAVEQELAAAAELLAGRPELAGFLSSPLVDEEARAGVLHRALRGRLSDLVVDALQVMNRKGRLGLVAALAEAYRRVNETRRGEVDVHVTSAVELSDALRRRIAEVAGRFAGGRARLVERVDPELIGGLVLQVGDRKVDASLSRQIHEVRDRLHQRASVELHGGKEYFDN